jgi:hypothetical protein
MPDPIDFKEAHDRAALDKMQKVVIARFETLNACNESLGKIIVNLVDTLKEISSNAPREIANKATNAIAGSIMAQQALIEHCQQNLKSESKI